MLWVVEQRSLWGDLGTVLISGYARRESANAPVRLHRAGPFLPPISFPWLPVGGSPMIVSQEFRQVLEGRNIPGLQFRPAIKDCIVRLPWHEWDRTAKEPAQYPRREPEDYIRGKKHHPRTAEQMLDAWELLPPVVPVQIDRMEDEYGGFLDRFRAHADRVEYPAFFANRADNYANLVVDEPIRQWLQKQIGEWVRFCEVEIVRGKADIVIFR